MALKCDTSTMFQLLNSHGLSVLNSHTHFEKHYTLYSFAINLHLCWNCFYFWINLKIVWFVQIFGVYRWSDIQSDFCSFIDRIIWIDFMPLWYSIGNDKNSSIRDCSIGEYQCRVNGFGCLRQKLFWCPFSAQLYALRRKIYESILRGLYKRYSCGLKMTWKKYISDPIINEFWHEN